MTDRETEEPAPGAAAEAAGVAIAGDCLPLRLEGDEAECGGQLLIESEKDDHHG